MHGSDHDGGVGERMADGDRKKKATAASSRSSTTGTRAAQRRVKLPDGGDGPRPVRVVRPPRPLWKKGGFWFGVILVEMVAAIGLSYAFTIDPDTMSLDGGDRAAFCELVRQYQHEVVPSTTGSALAGARASLEREAAGYRRLAPIAPDSVRTDLEKVAVLAEGLAAEARDLEAANAGQQSSVDALADLSRHQADVEARAEGAKARIDRVVLRACDVDVNAPESPATSPTTSASFGPTTGTSVPGSGGTVAGPSSSGTTEVPHE